MYVAECLNTACYLILAVYIC